MIRSILAIACPLFALAPVLAADQAGRAPTVGGQPATLVFAANSDDANVDPPAKVEMIKAAYLGVSTSPLAEAMAAQLKLPAGFGLVVDAVEKDGPAATVLQRHDILLRLGDQKLINAAQLRTLIRSHKPGDTVTMTLIREGKEQQAKVKLIEKEVPAHDSVMALPAPGPGGPRDLRWVEPLGPMWFDQPLGAMRYGDDEHQLEISVKDGQRTLIAKDKAGKVLFEGPITTEEDRKKLPAELRPKLEKLEKSARPRFRPLPGGVDLELDLDFGDLEKMLGKQLDNLPADADRQEIERRVKEMQDKVREQIRKMQEDFKKQRAAFDALELPPLDPAAPPQPGARAFEHHAAVSVASFSDGEHTLTVRTDDKGKTLTVKDKTGKEIFAGPINTPEQRAAVPAEIQEKLKQFENFKIKGGALRIHRGQNQPDQPPAAPRIERDEDRQN